MSLNRIEQMVCDYVTENPEELRYWIDKVKATAQAERHRHGAAAGLAEALGAYFEERRAVVAAFQAMAAPDELKPIGLRNLAEYWLRQWAPAPPRKKVELNRR